MRLFAALAISPEMVERLTRLHLRLSTPRDGLRWSTPEQWHITLQFFGEVDASPAACLVDGLGELAPASAPEIVLNSLERFAAKGILYAAVEVTPSLRQLQSEVVEISRRCGFIPDLRPFRPHVTLARSKGRTGLKSLQRLATPELPSFGTSLRWHAPEVLLLRSTLRPGGAEYTAEARVALHGAPAASLMVK